MYTENPFHFYIPFQFTTANKPQSFPPYDLITQTIDNKKQLLLNIALAGYKKEDIDIICEKTLILVEYSGESNQSTTNPTYVHNGIAKRKFCLKFNKHEFVKITKAVMEDGMLKIVIEEDIPEKEKPVKVDIM